MTDKLKSSDSAALPSPQPEKLFTTVTDHKFISEVCHEKGCQYLVLTAEKQKGIWGAEDYRRSADVHETAERIIKRVVSNVLSIAHTRHSLDETDGDPIEEKEFILDGLQVALGEDTGCLDPDDLSAENCEVLYVEEELREILTRAKGETS